MLLLNQEHKLIDMDLNQEVSHHQSEHRIIIAHSHQKIPSHAYSLTGGYPNEAFCIGQNNGKWEVYYSERGNKTSLKIFDTVSVIKK